jgi:large subunit ribosomal protein L13
MAKAETADQKWYVTDASGKVLGRLASEVAHRLRGKHKATYTPHVDTGDYIIVVNAEKVVLTGKKLTDKMYYSYSGYPGGLRETTAGKMLAENPKI